MGFPKILGGRSTRDAMLGGRRAPQSPTVDATPSSSTTTMAGRSRRVFDPADIKLAEFWDQRVASGRSYRRHGQESTVHVGQASDSVSSEADADVDLIAVSFGNFLKAAGRGNSLNDTATSAATEEPAHGGSSSSGDESFVIPSSKSATVESSATESMMRSSYSDISSFRPRGTPATVAPPSSPRVGSPVVPGRYDRTRMLSSRAGPGAALSKSFDQSGLQSNLSPLQLPASVAFGHFSDSESLKGSFSSSSRGVSVQPERNVAPHRSIKGLSMSDGEAQEISGIGTRSFQGPSSPGLSSNPREPSSSVGSPSGSMSRKQRSVSMKWMKGKSEMGSPLHAASLPSPAVSPGSTRSQMSSRSRHQSPRLGAQSLDSPSLLPLRLSPLPEFPHDDLELAEVLQMDAEMASRVAEHSEVDVSELLSSPRKPRQEVLVLSPDSLDKGGQREGRQRSIQIDEIDSVDWKVMRFLLPQSGTEHVETGVPPDNEAQEDGGPLVLSERNLNQIDPDQGSVTDALGERKSNLAGQWQETPGSVAVAATYSHDENQYSQQLQTGGISVTNPRPHNAELAVFDPEDALAKKICDPRTEVKVVDGDGDGKFWLGFMLANQLASQAMARMEIELVKERDSARLLAQVAASEWARKQEAAREHRSLALEMQIVQSREVYEDESEEDFDALEVPVTEPEPWSAVDVTNRSPDSTAFMMASQRHQFADHISYGSAAPQAGSASAWQSVNHAQIGNVGSFERALHSNENDFVLNSGAVQHSSDALQQGTMEEALHVMREVRRSFDEKTTLNSELPHVKIDLAAAAEFLKLSADRQQYLQIR